MPSHTEAERKKNRDALLRASTATSKAQQKRLPTAPASIQAARALPSPQRDQAIAALRDNAVGGALTAVGGALSQDTGRTEGRPVVTPPVVQPVGSQPTAPAARAPVNFGPFDRPVATPTVSAPPPTTTPAAPAGGAREQILGSLTRRSTGATQDYTGSQLAELASRVNTADLAGSTAELQRANAIRAQSLSGGSQASGGQDEVRQRLRERFLGGGIGSRAALEGLLQIRGQDADVAKAQAAVAGTSVRDQIAASQLALSQERLGLERSREGRAQREEFGSSINEALKPQLTSSDEDVQQEAQRTAAFATEIGKAAGLSGANAQGALRAANLLTALAEEADSSFTSFIPFFFEGSFRPESLTQFSNISFDPENESISFEDQGGNKYSTRVGSRLGFTPDLSARQAGELKSVFEQLGIKFNVKSSK